MLCAENEAVGYWVTSKNNGKSIFLPAATKEKRFATAACSAFIGREHCVMPTVVHTAHVSMTTIQTVRVTGVSQVLQCAPYAVDKVKK